MTANGEVQTREEATVYVKEFGLLVTVVLLEETSAILSLWKLCEDHGYTYDWTSGRKPHLIRNGKRIDCIVSNFVPFVVPGLSTSSSTTPTPTSSASSSQDSVFHVRRYAENPVPERSGSMIEELRWNPVRRQTETENKNKNEGREEVHSDLIEWLAGPATWVQRKLGRWKWSCRATENPAPKDQDTSSSSLELPMESRAKVESGSGKHSIYTHFPKDPNCDICLKTEITRASCRRRAGTVVPKAKNSLIWLLQITKF